MCNSEREVAVELLQLAQGLLRRRDAEDPFSNVAPHNRAHPRAQAAGDLAVWEEAPEVQLLERAFVRFVNDCLAGNDARADLSP